MDKQLLNTLNKNEKLVEMTEILIHNISVIKVVLYTCLRVNIFNKRKIETFEFPFYFKTKELAEEFLKYWDIISLIDTKYWDNKDKHCFGLYVSKQTNDSNVYTMVDYYKKLNSISFITDKSQLTYNGIWGGMVCKESDGKYYTFNRLCFDYKQILDLEDIGSKTNKTYIFKMVKD